MSHFSPICPPFLHHFPPFFFLVGTFSYIFHDVFVTTSHFPPFFSISPHFPPFSPIIPHFPSFFPFSPFFQWPAGYWDTPDMDTSSACGRGLPVPLGLCCARVDGAPHRLIPLSYCRPSWPWGLSRGYGTKSSGWNSRTTSPGTRGIAPSSSPTPKQRPASGRCSEGQEEAQPRIPTRTPAPV